MIINYSKLGGFYEFFRTKTLEAALKALATKLLFEQETWLVSLYAFFWFCVENRDIWITVKNPFGAICEPCKCCISLVSSQRRSWLFCACLQVLAMVVAWVLKKKVS